MNNKVIGGIVVVALAILSFEACSPAHGNSPGHEYMPDMAHSIAYEANKIDEYSLHTWDKESTKSLVELWGTPRMPINGTIPRGYAGLSNSTDVEALMKELTGQGRGISTPINGNVPYYYGDTEEERTRATREIVINPYPITKAGLTRGKELWITYCGICHGNKGAGDGYLVSEANPNVKYPAQPAILTQDTFVNGNNGRLYHAIMYGKNVMGGYADKLSYEERWQVIHYIRSFQAETKSLEYNENRNTFKPQIAVTDSAMKAALALRNAKAVATPAKSAAPVATTHAAGGHK